jgi:hypothetical protein
MMASNNPSWRRGFEASKGTAYPDNFSMQLKDSLAFIAQRLVYRS